MAPRLEIATAGKLCQRNASIQLVVHSDLRVESAPLIDVLQKAALFSALSHSELEALAKRATVRSCDAGVTLFSEGEACLGLYAADARCPVQSSSSSFGLPPVCMPLLR